MTSDDRLQAYLALGDEICQRTVQLTNEATPLLVADPTILSYRDRVLIGFALKTDSSFRSLIVDARACRLEAMHHLKTIVEARTYTSTLSPPTRVTAALVVARAFDKIASRFRDIKASPKSVTDYEGMRDELLAQIPIDRRHLPSVKGLAKDHGLDSWYQMVYRLACEPAHIADLVDFMPDPDRPVLTIGGDAASAESPRTALHYGIPIVLDLFRVLNDGNKLAIFVDVSTFRARYDAIRGETR